jgi:hypothetical protein
MVGMNDDSFDTVDQFKRALVVADRLRRQPRSRSALAAATRAGGVALVLRITATSTFSAVRVWLRARERISVMALAMSNFESP